MLIIFGFGSFGEIYRITSYLVRIEMLVISAIDLDPKSSPTLFDPLL